MDPDHLRILVINPGSTSTKTALFEGRRKYAEKTVEHGFADLDRFEHLFDQLFFREAVIRDFLREKGWKNESLDAVVGRGGMLHPVDGGIYAVGPEMLADLRSGRYGLHSSNLGAPLAREFSLASDCPSFIVDPVVVDELDAPARLSGHPELPRRSIFHALNQRAVARLAAAELGKTYETSRLIVCHMGGGITIGAHSGGRVFDVNNGLDGDGPFSPERSGSLPAGQLVSLCFGSGKNENEIRRMIKGTGGVAAYCGTNDIRELVEKACGSWRETGTDSSPGVNPDIGCKSNVESPGIVLEALCRQIAQGVCAHGATLEGKVDALVFTGGMAHSTAIMKRLRSMCEWMAPVKVFPGEQEMEALADGAFRALSGEEEVREYK